MIKKFLVLCFGVWLLGVSSSLLYANNSFQLIPESNNEQKADGIAEWLRKVKPEEDFWDKYNKWAKELQGDLGGQIRAGVFSRSSILQIGVYALRFMMQLALVIGSAFVIRAGYQYAGFALGFGDPKKWPGYIKNAAIGILIISLSYAIIKLLQMAFLN